MANLEILSWLSMSAREKVEKLQDLLDEQIEAKKEELQALFNKSWMQDTDKLRHVNWVLSGENFGLRNPGSFHRVIKKYTSRCKLELERGYLIQINFSLIILNLRIEEIQSAIFTSYLANRLDENLFADENDLTELLKLRIMQEVFIPIRIICEKTARLIDYLKTKDKRIDKKQGYDHQKCINIILEYILQKKEHRKDIFTRFNRNFFILTFFISQIRNISIHRSGHPIEVKTESVELVDDTQTKVLSYDHLILELRAAETIGQKLSKLQTELNKKKAKKKDGEDFPKLKENIGKFLEIYDNTFFKLVSLKVEGFPGLQAFHRRFVSRIDEKYKVFQVEVFSLLTALESYIYEILLPFCQILTDALVLSGVNMSK